jgi:hypothetical protein
MTETATATDVDELEFDFDDLFGDEPKTLAESIAPAEQVATVKARSNRRASRTESSALFFDLETVPDYDRLESFGLEPLPEVMAEATADQCPAVDVLLKSGLEVIEKRLLSLNPTDDYLDTVAAAESSAEKPRVGISKAIAAVRSARDKVKSAASDRLKLLSVTPEYCRIAAFGWAIGSGEVESLTCGVHAECDTADERTLLEAFWSLVTTQRPLIGFNIVGFDLRVIFVRSALLGVTPSRLLDMKPWGKDVIDLMEARFNRSQAMGLKKLAPLYGIEVPAGDCEGSQVAGLMETDPRKVGDYVRSDVTITRELYRCFCGYFCA